MMLGLSLTAFTALHVIISLIAIATGLVVLAAMLANRNDPTMTALFLATTVLTSVTGFMFEFAGFTPAHLFGAISLVVLAAALFALYGRGLAGAWRPVYVGCAVFALYLNVFVLVVQSFQKIESLQALAPTQSESPFQIAQLVVLVAFGFFGFRAVKRFHPAL
jgi:hypothetical protein